jgi:CheY-like chemotaxis protein
MKMKTVLLVEDNRLVKIMHERVLNRAGYKVYTAGDGEEALKVARQVFPDAILLDMMLPKLSGPEVLRALKSNPATAGIAVIVVTGLSKKNAPKLEEAGADAFVEKEELLASTDPLLRTLERVLRETAGRQKTLEPADAAMAWAPGEIEAAAGVTKTAQYNI